MQWLDDQGSVFVVVSIAKKRATTAPSGTPAAMGYQNEY
jgi:hypothetical protein